MSPPTGQEIRGLRERLRRVFSRPSFAETALKMTEVAPTFPPLLVSHGVELSHSLRKAIGDRPVEASLWEELLARRRGPGADAFFAFPLAPTLPPEDLLLQRAVEIRALVDAIRNARYTHVGQPLDRILRQGSLRTRREVVSTRNVPVAVRLGDWFIVVGVGEEHPRALRDRLMASFRDEARSIGGLRSRRIIASVLVCIDPVPLADALHLHRIGLEGPWMAWSTTSGDVPLGVLAAHHLVLEGPGFASLRADFRSRVRAMTVALGLDGAQEGVDLGAEFGSFDAEPFHDFPGIEESLAGMESLDPELLARLHAAEEELDDARLSLGSRQNFAVSPEQTEGERAFDTAVEGLPEALLPLLEDRDSGRRFSVRRGGPSWRPPALRYATLPRGAFSFPDFCYAYCRAQHDAMAVHHPSYHGAGFTFIVPGQVPSASGQNVGRRPSPVLCSFRTVRGVPEAPGPFKHRLRVRLREAEAGQDLLSTVLDDVLRVAMPEVFKTAAVRLFESRLHDGGTFLSGRGLVSHIEVPDEQIDPVAQYGGIFEGLFGGSCQERGGIALTAVDRGYRRDLCAVGTGIFRSAVPMDFFWNRLAYFLREAAL
ncbi:MAG: hypothetical protein VX498_00890 [Myxococcota bacterium]|nr:hypothetical protein [Myxococcota bacterium]